MARAGDDEYDGFVHRHGRRHSSWEEYEDRRAIYHQKKAYIQSWNARAAADDPHAHKCDLLPSPWVPLVMLPTAFTRASVNGFSTHSSPRVRLAACLFYPLATVTSDGPFSLPLT